jgi:hypothetical protein
MLGMHLPSPFTNYRAVQSHIDDSVTEDVGNDGETNSDTDGDEDKAILVGAEMVDFCKSVRDRGEKCEEHGEGKCGVERDESNERLKQQHMHGSDESDGDNDL